MSILEEVLKEEYERSRRISEAIEAELAELPRGSVRKRTVRGHTYYYLQYRVGKKVRSDYVRREDVEALRAKLARRREDIAALKEQEQTRAQIRRALGRRKANERAGT